MGVSTNLISGLSSGFDWRTMIDQLIAIEHKRVDLVENQKSEYESKLSELQSINTKLLALKTAADGLKDSEDFYLYTSSMSTDSSTVYGDDRLSVSTSTSAAPGTYEIVVTNLAQAQKLSSNPFTSQTSDLGSSYAGDIIINAKVLTISATDSLADVAYNINALNTGTDPSGVTASVINYGTNDYRLVMTSNDTGADGISLLNGSATNLLQKYGWKDKQTAVIKNSITQGAQSDRFTSSNVAIKTLLGLSTGESGDVTIGDQTVTINLSTMSLTEIKDAINTAGPTGVIASVVSETVDGTTFYRLQVEGTETFSDASNILNTLGVLHNGSTQITAADTEISGNSMTTNGAYISADTLLVNIDGYISYIGGDKITLTGSDVSGAAITASDLSISSTTTVQDLLYKIETLYSVDSGDVVAYITSDGKIRVDDVAGGGGLSVTLTDSITSGQLEFVDGDADFGDASAREREIVAGSDATITVDGVQVTDSSNTIEDVIEGVTLNLVGEDSGTTVNVTLNIERDIDVVKSNIQNFVDTYNDVMSYINTQFSYDENEEETGGVLFGDSTLRSIKSDLTSVLTQQVSYVDSDFSYLSLIGIENKQNADGDWELNIDNDTLTGYLETNFNDVMSLFAAQGTSDDSTLSYIAHSRETAAGEYDVYITTAATQSSTTSVDSTAAGIETLTITNGGMTAEIGLDSTMSLNDIVNAINTELDAVYTETFVGSEQLYSDVAHTTPIAASTTWDSIYDSSGASANLSQSDRISFSGTTHNGSSISGYYDIGTVSTDTVQSLLTAVEDAYNNKVTAYIDNTGRIALTDKLSGNSQLSISFTESTDLDLGNLTTTGSGSELLSNGDFETGGTGGTFNGGLEVDDGTSDTFTNWTNYEADSNKIEATATADNGYAAKITTAGTSTDVWTYQDIAVTAGQTYEVTLGVRGDGTGSVRYRVEDTFDSSDVVAWTDTAETGTGYVEKSFSFTATSDSVHRLYLSNNALSSVSYVDTVSVKEYYGGQEGRNAIPVTATTDTDGDQLVLTQDDYGSGHTFTVQESRDDGLWNTSDPAVTNGEDVAGTIGSKTATGAGQVLTGTEGDVEDLVITYSGTSQGLTVGTLTFTLGLAELFEHALYDITDSIDGYMAFKQDSIQDRVGDLKDQIEDMEARLDRKMEQLINRFVAMELALSKIQSQSNWLTAQLTTANKGWV